MPNKKEILKYAKQNGFIYPNIKVIFGFGIVGGMVGGFLVWLGCSFYIIVENITNHHDISFMIDNLLHSISALPMTSFYGILFGGIPALLTGIYLSIKKFIIIKRKDYGLLFLIGCFSVLFFLTIITILIIIDNPSTHIYKHNDIIIITIPLAIIGGLSTMICGRFFLPKLPPNFYQ